MGNKIHKSILSWKQMGTIYSAIKMPWAMLVISIVLGILYTQVNAQIPAITGELVEANGAQRNVLYLYVGCMAAGLLLKYVQELLANRAYERINQRARYQVWKTILGMSNREYDKESASYYISRITSDADSVYAPISTLINMGLSIYSFCIYTYNMFTVNAVLAKYVMIVLPFAILFSIMMGRFKYKANYNVRQKGAATTRYLTERSGSLKLVKAQNAEQSENTTAHLLFGLQWKAAKYLCLIEIICIPLGLLITNGSKIIAYGIGGNYAANGWISVSAVISFEGYAALVCTSAWLVFYMYPLAIKSAQGSIGKLAELLQMDKEHDGDQDLRNTSEGNKIVFEHVSFSYGEEAVLKDINLIIPEGKAVALFGTNGSGKSTIFKLLEKFYEPTSGRILVEGQNLKEIKTQDWRKTVGFVSQNYNLLDGTLLENLLYGIDRDVPEAEIQYALEAARADTFIAKLPNGLNTEIGEGGCRLSGGERQRLCIARMLLRKPRLILLDEATSALDCRNEKMVLENIRSITRGCTILMIAHSIEAARIADKVAVLDHGEISAFGKPKDVLPTDVHEMRRRNYE